MYIPPGNANISIQGSFTGGDQVWMTSCGFGVSSWGDGDGADAVDYVENCDWVDNANSGTRFDNIRVTIGTSNPSAPLVFNYALNVTGGGTGGAPPQVCWLLDKHTFMGGRKGRGRGFFPGPTASGVDAGGNLVGDTAAQQAMIEEFWPDLDSAVQALNTPKLFHQFEESPTNITGFSCQAKVGTQRGRMR